MLMVDARLDIAALIAANEAEHIVVPIVAAGVGVDPMIATSAEFDALVEKEIAINAALVNAIGLRPQ